MNEQTSCNSAMIIPKSRDRKVMCPKCGTSIEVRRGGTERSLKDEAFCAGCRKRFKIVEHNGVVDPRIIYDK